jgi:hypothetical protein
MAKLLTALAIRAAKAKQGQPALAGDRDGGCQGLYVAVSNAARVMDSATRGLAVAG